MKPRAEIAFTEDIAEDVAEDMGYSKEVVMYHIGFLVWYIKKLTRMPKVTGIYLPLLGTLYVNWSRTKHDLDRIIRKEGNPHYKNLAVRKRFIEIRLQTLEEAYGGKKGYLTQKKKSKVSNWHFTKDKSKKELEEWQNREK